MILSWLTAAAASTALSAEPAPQADPGEVHVWRLAHYLQEDHVFISGWLTDWVETLEARSDGRIRVEWHHNNSLLRLAAIAPGVAAGEAEMGFATAPPHGEFTLVGLPFMAGSAVHGAGIVNALLEEGALDDAFEGLVPALVITNAPSLLHTRGVAVREPDELAGLRLRGATPGIRSLIAALGAIPVEGYLAPRSRGFWIAARLTARSGPGRRWARLVWTPMSPTTPKRRCSCPCWRWSSIKTRLTPCRTICRRWCAR